MSATVMLVSQIAVFIALAVNVCSIWANWKSIRAHRKLNMMLLILCNNAWTMRGWPLHEILEYGARREAAKMRRRG